MIIISFAPLLIHLDISDTSDACSLSKTLHVRQSSLLWDSRRLFCVLSFIAHPRRRKRRWRGEEEEVEANEEQKGEEKEEEQERKVKNFHVL